jgi:hypothetical protein
MANGEYKSRRIPFIRETKHAVLCRVATCGRSFPRRRHSRALPRPLPGSAYGLQPPLRQFPATRSPISRATRGPIMESLMSRPAVSSLQLGPGQGHGLTDPPTTRKDTSADMMCAPTNHRYGRADARPHGILCPPGGASTSEETARLHHLTNTQQWRLTAQSEAMQFVFWP